MHISIINYDKGCQLMEDLLHEFKGGLKAKITNSVVSQQIFIQKALSQKRKVGGSKSIHFLKALFKTCSKIDVWWLLLSE